MKSNSVNKEYHARYVDFPRLLFWKCRSQIWALKVFYCIKGCLFISKLFIMQSREITAIGLLLVVGCIFFRCLFYLKKCGGECVTSRQRQRFWAFMLCGLSRSPVREYRRWSKALGSFQISLIPIVPQPNSLRDRDKTSKYHGRFDLVVVSQYPTGLDVAKDPDIRLSDSP